MSRARGRMIIVAHRRRREQKTDYYHRLRLLRSGKERLVIRRFSNDILCQIVMYKKCGDKTLISANSKELVKLGWLGSRSNIPSAYLTGLLLASKAKKAKITEAVLDIGTQTSNSQSRIYGALKGVVDGGVKVPHSESILPNAERLSGKHISDYALKLKKESSTTYKKLWSASIKNKFLPENIQEYFLKTKSKIMKK